MKRNRLLMGVLAALLADAAGAATIGLVPNDAIVDVGDLVDVRIVGSAFSAGDGGTVGGAVSVTWDPARIFLESYGTDAFRGDKLFADANTTTTKDVVAGTLLNLSVLSLNGVPDANFDIATLTFRGLQPGTTTLGIEIGRFDSNAENRWFDSSGTLDAEPLFEGTTLRVNAVPLPPALVLLGGAVLGLGGIRSRIRERRHPRHP
jgi:hypothetical protein